MPALPPVAGVIRADFPFTVGEDVNALNRVFINYTGTAPNDAVCAALAGDLGVDWATVFKIYSVSDVAFQGCTVTDLSTESGGQGSYLNAVQGTYDETLWPAGIAFIGSMKIARRYRGGKPRTYLPCGAYGLMEDAQTWTSVFTADMQAALDQIISDISVTANGGTSLVGLVNVSYYKGFVNSTNPVTGRTRAIPLLRNSALQPTPGPPLVDTVNAWVAEVRFASQRRRNLRSS